MVKIYKTFSDVLEESVIRKYNHNHDSLGRFAAVGAGKRFGSSSKGTSERGLAGDNDFKETGTRRVDGKTMSAGESSYTKQIKDKVNSAMKKAGKSTTLDTIREVRDSDGVIAKWEIGIKGKDDHKILIECMLKDDNYTAQDYEEDFLGGIDEIKAAFNHDINAMEDGDLEYFDIDPNEDYGSGRSDFSDYLGDDDDCYFRYEVTDPGFDIPATMWDPPEYEAPTIEPEEGSDPYGFRDAFQDIEDGMDYLEKSVDKYNPYHDQLGRFTTDGGAKVTVPYTPKGGKTRSSGKKTAVSNTTTTTTTAHNSSSQSKGNGYDDYVVEINDDHVLDGFENARDFKKPQEHSIDFWDKIGYHPSRSPKHKDKVIEYKPQQLYDGSGLTDEDGYNPIFNPRPSKFKFNTDYRPREMTTEEIEESKRRKELDDAIERGMYAYAQDHQIL